MTGPPPSPIAVNYDVILDTSDSVYTYLYSFTAYPNDVITTFNVNVNSSYLLSVLAYGTSLSYYGPPAGFGATVTGSDVGPFGFTITPTTTSWSFDPTIEPILETVAFTSLYGPSNGTASLIDDGNGPWGDNPGSPSGATPIPVPSPVPEASTVMAGALMLLPFGIGAIRSLRRERML
jgi:hypothetical protein